MFFGFVVGGDRGERCPQCVPGGFFLGVLIELGEYAIETFAVVAENEIILGREVREERPGRQTCFGRYQFDGRLVEAVPFEQV